MQPRQPFMYGGGPPPSTSNYHPVTAQLLSRGRVAVVPAAEQVHRSSSIGGAAPLTVNRPLHYHQPGSGVNIGVLPALHGTHLAVHNRIPLGHSSNTGPVPIPPPTGTRSNSMRRYSGAMQAQLIGYPSKGNSVRSVPMVVCPNCRPSAQKGVSCTAHVHGGILKEMYSSGISVSQSEVSMKSVGGGAAQRISNLPSLPSSTAPIQNWNGSALSMPQSTVMSVNLHSNIVIPSYVSSGAQMSASGGKGYYPESNGVCVGGSASGGKADGDGGRDVERATASLSGHGNAHNVFCVNTPPPLENWNEDTGLTPSPPSLRFLTRYEEEEVKDYLPDVYFSGSERCNKIQGVRGSDCNDGYDDNNCHYRVLVGDHLVYRYEVLKVLGQGTFGIVVRALDHKHRRTVAVKVIKNKPNYTKQAREEIKTLELLNKDDPNDDANIVRLLGSHIFRQHYILVFELLPSDLYAVIQSNKFRAMSREFIYELSEQLLSALVHVRSHNIVHCDLKPENIMISFRDRSSGSVGSSIDFSLKLIDFGSACEEKRAVLTYIQSRYYRAPEIVLGIPYTTAIDMWSFGCVLCELANGYPIFPATSEGELLERIVEYLGPIPPYLIRQGRRADRFFENGQMKYNLGKKRLPHAPHSRVLRNFLKVGRSHQDKLFEDFVAGCLHLDAQQRFTPEAALEHPWMDFWRENGSSGSVSPSDYSSFSPPLMPP